MYYCINFSSSQLTKRYQRRLRSKSEVNGLFHVSYTRLCVNDTLYSTVNLITKYEPRLVLKFNSYLIKQNCSKIEKKIYYFIIIIKKRKQLSGYIFVYSH